MSLAQVYEAYLANPVRSAGSVAEDASMSYVNTLTTIHGATAIAKHHTAHEKVLKKKEQKVIDRVEGGLAISLDVETTLEFLNGGGAYLPGLDDNFVSDRVVIFPMVHIVHFNAEQKIKQIRIYWDQGSLLKQIDVIGKSGRNWPIRDGKDQARLIASSKATTATNGHTAKKPSISDSAAGNPATKPRTQSTNVTRDPHASLALFEEDGGQSAPKAIAPRANSSAKPPPRNYQDLFVGEESPVQSGKGNVSSPKKENSSMRPPPPKASSSRPPTRDFNDLFGGEVDDQPQAPSPDRSILSPGGGAPKFGAGKNYKPSRLFDTGENDSPTPSSPSKSAYKADPKKYNHFDFGHGEDAVVDQTPRPKTRHQSQWDFEDFHTPMKPAAKPQNPQTRNFSVEGEQPAEETTSKSKARPDANPHFEFQDDGALAGERPQGQPRGGVNVRTTGLYQNHLFNDGEQSTSSDKSSKPLATVTNLQDRRKDFDAHFAMSDSPSGDGRFPAEAEKPVPDARKKVVNAMAAHWAASDDSPGSAHNNGSTVKTSSGSSNKENIDRPGGGGGAQPGHIGIKSGGDGMGGKKGTTRLWGFGDDSDGEQEVFRASRKAQGPKDNSFWDF